MSSRPICRAILLGLMVALLAAGARAQDSTRHINTWAANSVFGEPAAGPAAGSPPAARLAGWDSGDEFTFFGGYSFLDSGLTMGLHNDICGVCAGRVPVSGWEFAGTRMLNKNFGLTFDYSGHNTTGCENACPADLDEDSQFFLGGLTAVKRFGSHVSLFGHGLAGVSLAGARAELSFNTEQKDCPPSTCPFIPHNVGPAVAAGGGADYMLTRHWGIRVIQLDYLWSYMRKEYATTARASVNDLRVSAGILMRIGGPK